MTWSGTYKLGHAAFRCSMCSGVVSLPLEDAPSKLGGPSMAEWIRRGPEFEALRQAHVCPSPQPTTNNAEAT